MPETGGTPIPRATYRQQFRKGFGFRDAAALAPYLARFGISAADGQARMTVAEGPMLRVFRRFFAPYQPAS